MDIFKLVGSIFVDTDEANNSLSKTDEKAGNLGKTLVNGAATAGKFAVGLTTACSAGVAALVGVASSAAETMDTIDKGAEKIGISQTAYQEWDYVLGQNGMSIDKLEVGMKTLVSQMDSALAGTESAVENFDKLGVSIYDANGNLKDQETMLKEAVYALANMENGTEKARLATELFGKAGIEMMPMLNNGAEGIAELTDRAHDLGLVLSDEAVDAGVVLGDTMDDVKKSFSMIGTNIGASIIPVVQQFADLILENMPMIQSAIGALGPVLAGVVATFLPVMADMTQTLLPMLIELINQIVPILSEVAADIMPVFVELINMLLPPLIEIVQMAMPLLISILDAIMPLLNTVIELLSPILELFISLLAPIMELVSYALEPLVAMLAEFMNSVLQPLIPVIEFLAQALTSVLKEAFVELQPAIDGIMKAFGGLIDFITGVFSGDWEKAWNGIIDIFSGIFSGMVNLIKVPINAIIKAINGVFGAIGTIEIPDWVPLVGGSSFSLPQIPLLAKGGKAVESGKAIVGEAGAELIDLPAGAKVTPLTDGNGKALGLDKIERKLDELVSLITKVSQTAYGVYLNETALVGQLAPSIDQELGRIAVRNGRGV